MEEIDEKDDIEVDSNRASDDDYADHKNQNEPRSKKFRRLSNTLQFFEKEMSLGARGAQNVWKTEITQIGTKVATIYLLAVYDSKVFYRIGNKYAALPRVQSQFSEKDLESGFKIEKIYFTCTLLLSKPYGVQRPIRC